MSFKSFVGLETDAEAARAEHDALVLSLRAKQQPPVVGEFTPQTAGLALAQDAVILRGGPFDGTETKVPRGSAQYERPAGGTDGFFPARYKRTAKRTEDGLTVFQFQDQTAA